MSYSFDPVYARDRLVAEIRHYANEQGFKKVVVGISGGKDSTVTAALCARALGKENVFGVLLPDGEQKDIEDSRWVCDALGIPNITINIEDIHKEILLSVDMAVNLSDDDFFIIDHSEESNINVPPRIRMTVLRYITQCLGARLAGTGNLSEMTVGYCTKDGDTSCDFSVLGGLTSVEVVQVGLTMNELPKELVLKTPSDGLCGMSDEEKLGVSYDDIHHYIRRDRLILDLEAKQKIDVMNDKSAHKRRDPKVMYNPEDALWL